MAKSKLVLAGAMTAAMWVSGAGPARAGDHPPMPHTAETDGRWGGDGHGAGESWPEHPTACQDACPATCRGGGLFDWVGDGLLGCPGECLGEPWSLFGSYQKYSVGGWAQLGYHNRALPTLNSKPHDFQLQQAWLYAERAIDTSMGFDIGGRIDYLYGTDGPDVQAFGSGLRGLGQGRGWDSGWERGAQYGHALPQAYLEAGYGDTSIIAGNFFSIIGYEQIAAPQNFFYSRNFSRYFSTPFTHTGVLAKHVVSPDITVYGGYTLGWDSGFNDNGDSFLGGVTLGLTDTWTMTYATTIGRFGEARFHGVEKGYMHSIVSQHTLSDRLQYISQSDVLSTEDGAGNTVRETYGINQYLIYQLNDRWAVGSRFEWYQSEGVFTAPGETADIYALTMGLNHRPHANVIVRPEIRWDWVDNNGAVLDNVATNDGRRVVEGGKSQATFGVDTIFLF